MQPIAADVSYSMVCVSLPCTSLCVVHAEQLCKNGEPIEILFGGSRLMGAKKPCIRFPVLESPGIWSRSLKVVENHQPVLSIFHCCVLQRKVCLLNCFSHRLPLTSVTCVIYVKGMLGVRLFKCSLLYWKQCDGITVQVPCWMLPSDYCCIVQK